MALAFLSQSILHGLIAALFVEALFWAWRVEDGTSRMRLRLVALAAPLLWLPLLFVAAPFRSSPVFVARWALFAGERWDQIELAGVGLGRLSLLAACGIGAALFLRDALPPVLDALRGSSLAPAAGAWYQTVGALRGPIAARAAAFAMRAPDVRVVDTPMPVLLCEGVTEPVLVVSPATLHHLAPEELDSAIAHELAHAKHRDPAWGYLLIAARALLFFNPAAQWLARALVDDIERRADQAAVGVTGNAEGLARAIGRLFDAGYPPSIDGDASFERVFLRIRRAGVERRCARLRQGLEPAAAGPGPALLAMAALGVFGLAFFVV
jgi:Zn-dependent protease with chaperone function